MPKSYLVPLCESFLDYLYSDDIILPMEEDVNEVENNDPNNNIFTYSNNEKSLDPATS